MPNLANHPSSDNSFYPNAKGSAISVFAQGSDSGLGAGTEPQSREELQMETAKLQLRTISSMVPVTCQLLPRILPSFKRLFSPSFFSNLIFTWKLLDNSSHSPSPSQQFFFFMFPCKDSLSPPGIFKPRHPNLAAFVLEDRWPGLRPAASSSTAAPLLTPGTCPKDSCP